MLSEPMQIEMRRAVEAGTTADGADAVFALLDRGAREGIPSALITIVGIEGGAPRELGAHMAALADGRYCGYVSGGCVEAAVAAEAIGVIAEGKDKVLRFGAKSPFFDIKLPCGGGIDLLIHVNPARELVSRTLPLLKGRVPVALRLGLDSTLGQLIEGEGALAPTGWQGEVFHRRYAPKTRLALVGRGLELETVTRIAASAGFDVHAISPDEYSLAIATELGAATTRLTTPTDVPDLPIDPWTAVVFLFHDHDWETALLASIVESPAFFIGALGSRNTHAQRCAHLVEAGVPQDLIGRIRGPIGLFGPTRDADALTLSVLAQISEERMVIDAQ